MTRRTDRVNELLRQEISQLLSRDLNDPRLSGLVSITQVETTTDLRHARVFVSVFGYRQNKEDVLNGISSAARFLRRELGERLSLRYIPELKFVLDDSLDKAEHIYEVMDQLSADSDPDPGLEETSAGTQP